MSKAIDAVTRRSACRLLLGGALVPLIRTDLGWAAAAAAVPPPADGLPRATPESVGIDSAAILAFLDDIEANGFELHSFMLWRHGYVVAEGWWSPYRADRIHMMHSLTKSVTGCAVGLAIAEGHFKLDDKVVSFFPEQLPSTVSDNLAAMTIS
jgi:CubicO group peptidase (beta-lactamase class C family)